MSIKLNQIIAIEKGVKTGAAKAFTAAYREIQKADPLSGISRTYVPMADDGVQQPPEMKLPQVRVRDEINDLVPKLTRMFDVVATKDNANTGADADIVVGGVTILQSVPITTLLFLEKQLAELKEFVSKFPILDPAEQWTYSPAHGFYVSAPAQTIRASKVLKNHVLYEPTKEHPAQVTTYSQDVPEGTWTTVKYSGALPRDTVIELAARVELLTMAVKQARERANSIEVTDTPIGAPFFDYLFSPLNG